MLLAVSTVKELNATLCKQILAYKAMTEQREKREAVIKNYANHNSFLHILVFTGDMFSICKTKQLWGKIMYGYFSPCSRGSLKVNSLDQIKLNLPGN